MDESSLECLIEQIQKSLEQVLQMRVLIASNTVEINSLFEHLHIALIQAGRNDPKFLDIVANTKVDETLDRTMESLFQEINVLILEFDKYF